MGQFLLHALLFNCDAHSECMIVPQHVNHVRWAPHSGSAPRQIEQTSSSSSKSSPAARAGAAALFVSPADIKLAGVVVRRGGESGGSETFWIF